MNTSLYKIENEPTMSRRREKKNKEYEKEARQMISVLSAWLWLFGKFSSLFQYSEYHQNVHIELSQQMVRSHFMMSKITFFGKRCRLMNNDKYHKMNFLIFSPQERERKNKKIEQHNM